MNRGHYLCMVLVFTCCLAVGGCGKEGPTGPTGATGQTGPPGPPGSANVSTVVFSFTTGDITGSGNVKGYGHPVAAITQQVVDGGFVLLYLKLGEAWMALPWTIGIDYSENLEVDEVIEITYAYSVGQIDILYSTSDDVLLTSGLPTGPFKVVIVPPSSAQSLQGIDLHSYQAVTKALEASGAVTVIGQ